MINRPTKKEKEKKKKGMINLAIIYISQASFKLIQNN